MTITSYATLKTAVATRLARSDYTALIPDFIYNAHSKMIVGDDIDGVPPLRFADMLTEVSLTPSSGAAILPADYLGIKRVYTNNSDTLGLAFRPPEDWYSLSFEGQSGTPKFYTIEGGTLKIAPMDTTVLKLLYYAKLAQLAVDGDTNAVITKAPHVYLYGALAEAYDHMRQHDRAQMYAKRFASGVRALNDSSDNAQMSGAPLVMMPSVVD